MTFAISIFFFLLFYAYILQLKSTDIDIENKESIETILDKFIIAPPGISTVT